MIQPEAQRFTKQVDVPRFGLKASRFRTKMLVFGQPFFVLLAVPALLYLTALTDGPFLLLVPLVPVAAALNFYLYGVRFPVTLEVRNDELHWSGLFSERSVPIHAVVGARVYGISLTGFTIKINGANNMSIPMVYKEWNKFTQAVNHYYPSCNLPPNKTRGRWSSQMKYFHE